MWQSFMDELRHLHCSAQRPERSVFGELQAAFEAATPGR